MATQAIPISVLPRLLLAGWLPRRDVWARLRLPPSPPLFPEARRVLSRFGRLRFGDRNEHVLFDPIAVMDDDGDLLRRCEAAVGRRLYPLGYQEHQDREAIFVDEDGAIYVNFGDDLRLLAASFEASLRYLARPGAARSFRAVSQTAGIQPRHWSVGPARHPAPAGVEVGHDECSEDQARRHLRGSDETR